MPRRWFIGSCYGLIAAVDIYRSGPGSLYWIAWALMAAGVLTVVYTPVGRDGKTSQTLALSSRNKISLAVTILGVLLLAGLAIFYRRY